MSVFYNPRDWYWIVGGDTSKVFSSRIGRYVDPAADQDFLAFLGSNRPTRIVSEAELLEVLEQQAPGAVMATKAGLLAYAKRRRWEIETGGFQLNGLTIATDDRSKLMIQGARTGADANPQFVAKWDIGNSSVELNAAQIIGISDAVAAHVNAVFARHDTIRDEINAEQIITAAEVDAAFAA